MTQTGSTDGPKPARNTADTRATDDLNSANARSESQGDSPGAELADDQANRPTDAALAEADANMPVKAPETQPARKQKQNRQPGGRRRPAQPQEARVVTLPPAAAPARMRRRHWGGIFAFFLIVIAPLSVAIWYLWERAEDRYVSTAGFTVRAENNADAAMLLGGLAQLAGGSSNTSDAHVLYAFIQSRDVVASIDAEFDMRGHFSQHWDTDPVFSLKPDASLEDLADYWTRIMQVNFDSVSGLIEVTINAFDPAYAQAIAQAVLNSSQAMINKLNVQAREDAMRYALEDLEKSLARLKSAREAMTQYRTSTQIVDPQADIQGRMGVMSNLQQQLAETLIEYDLLRLNATPGDPRLLKTQQRIEVIRSRIAREREAFASDGTETGDVNEDYPTLIAEFENLSVDLLFAEETYRAALASVDVARAEATRQSRYLATYIRPSLADSPTRPQRETLALLVAGCLLLGWALMALVYYSLRDRG